MNRRTFDIAVPIVWVVAMLVAIAIGDEGGVGGVAIIGAVGVVAYFAALRQNIKA
jgi:hypothetical protein